MKRALNKGVKKYVKLLWGKRSMPDSGAVGYPAVLAGALFRTRASIGSARGSLPRGTWLPRECYSPGGDASCRTEVGAFGRGCWRNGP